MSGTARHSTKAESATLALQPARNEEDLLASMSDAVAAASSLAEVHLAEYTSHVFGSADCSDHHRAYTAHYASVKAVYPSIAFAARSHRTAKVTVAYTLLLHLHTRTTRLPVSCWHTNRWSALDTAHSADNRHFASLASRTQLRYCAPLDRMLHVQAGSSPLPSLLPAYAEQLDAVGAAESTFQIADLSL